MTAYRFSDFNKLLKKLGQEGVGLLAIDPKHLFYDHPSADDYNEADLQRSADVIAEYLKSLADEFSNKADYNSYKHGLRTLRAKKSTLTISTLRKELFSPQTNLPRPILSLKGLKDSKMKKSRVPPKQLTSKGHIE